MESHKREVIESICEFSDENQLIMFLITYGLNDTAAAKKQALFDTVQKEIDDCEGLPIIMGDIYGQETSWNGMK